LSLCIGATLNGAMMTSFAFILGVIPLVIATGASKFVSTPVFGGMLFASLLGIFVIPPLYVMFQAIRERLQPGSRPLTEGKPVPTPTRPH
jgi:Cu/Ag efflux pump CusA